MVTELTDDNERLERFTRLAEDARPSSGGWLEREPGFKPGEQWMKMLSAVSLEDLATVSRSIRADVHSHPSDATCSCPAATAITRLLSLGYTIVPPAPLPTVADRDHSWRSAEEVIKTQGSEG